MRYGHFDDDASEYVIDDVCLPGSWINYLGVENWCAIVNQHAGGYAFFGSPERGRVTRFRPNAVPKDSPGHWVYLRDDETGDYWSATWQPVGKPIDQAVYKTRHGLSYSVFEGQYDGVATSQTLFVPLGDDAEIWDVTVTNHSGRPRLISLFGYCEFSFHFVPTDNQNLQMSLYATGASYEDGIIEEVQHYEPATRHFFTATRPDDGFDTSREAFIGVWGTESAPAAVVQGRCSNSQLTTQNHVGALRHQLALAPGQSLRLAYILGRGPRQVGAALRDKYQSADALDQALAGLAAYWAAKRAAFALSTPNAAMNSLIGAWTLYQAETCLTWSRFASFVEVGGRTGLGFRDTAQDAYSLAHTNPDKTLQRLAELLAGQMSPGFGLHLFEPQPDRPAAPQATVVPGEPRSRLHGLADVCSDDHLWLVPSVVEWVKETGRFELFDEIVPFADSGCLASERVGLLGEAAPRFDPRPATVYEHLRRAVEFSAGQVADNGIAKGLRADWNDCLNLGGGQSSLVTFLQIWAARALAEASAALIERGADLSADLMRWHEIAEAAQRAAQNHLWDGHWYIRGLTADGTRIGSARSGEGQIFLEHMPWAVISGAAGRGRGRQALDAVHEHLASPFGVHLMGPSFTAVDDSIGFITRVYPGVKENGAVFSHPNAWLVMAETMLGRGQMAMRYYDALAPYWQNDDAQTRRAEPYVYAQFTYGRDHQLCGRAENPWLTGTAGWMYTAASKYILGVRPGFHDLVIDPCIPPDWDGFTVRRTWRGSHYDIVVRNPAHVSCGVGAVKTTGDQRAEMVEDQLRGRPVAVVPQIAPGRTIRVEVSLGG